MRGWCTRYGDLDPKQAEMAAVEQYPFEASDKPYRGLVFHDEAWHWAMLAIHGNQYWLPYPPLETPSAEYRALN